MKEKKKKKKITRIKKKEKKDDDSLSIEGEIEDFCPVRKSKPKKNMKINQIMNI